MLTGLKRFVARLRALFMSDEDDHHFQQELGSHLSMSFEERIGLDLTAEEVGPAQGLGGTASLRHQDRGLRRQSFVDAVGLDIKFALRSLAASPQFTCLACLTIVLTVSAVSIVFTLVNGVLLTPLPFPGGNRLVAIAARDATGPMAGSPAVSAADLEDIRRDARTLEAATVYRAVVQTISPDRDPYRVTLWSTTSDLFRAFDIHPVRGRGLEAEDEKPGSPSVAVIAYELWIGRFGQRQDILGQQLRLPRGPNDSGDFTIVGVMPPAFEIPAATAPPFPAVWTTIRVSALDRRSRVFGAIGKLREGVSLPAARAELDGIGRRLAAAYPDTNRERTFEIARLLDRMVGDTKQVLWMFFAAVTFVLLIAVANLISLQIARNAARERDFMICAALGGGRGRLVRQQLVETTCLSVAAGLVAVVVTWSVLGALVRTLPAPFPRADRIVVTPEAILFTFGVCLTVGIVFGLIPAWRISRPDLTTAINEGTKSASISARRSRLQRLLIAAETALALILVIGAMLFAISFWKLFTTDAAIADEDHLISVSVSLPLEYHSANRERAEAFWRSAIDNVRGMPSVESVALAVNAPAPLSGGDILVGGVMAEGSSNDRRRDGITLSNWLVSGDYFKTLGIPVVAGRPILEFDRADVEPVTSLNQAAARAFWPIEIPWENESRTARLLGARTA